MIRRRWLRALLVGLSSTLFITMYLSLHIQPGVSERPTGSHEKRTHPHASQNYASKRVTVDSSHWTLKHESDISINVPVRKSVKRNPVKMNNSLHRTVLKLHNVGDKTLNASQLLRPLNTSSSFKEIRNDRMFKSISNQTVFLDEYVKSEEPEINLVIACCLTGEESDKKQLALTKTFLKSLFTLNRNNIQLHVYVLPHFNEPVINLVSGFKSGEIHFDVNYYNASMPDIEIMVKDGPIWTKNVTLTTLFKPCSAQRLFLPYTLPTLDRVLYMDTDTLVLGPLNQVWNSFRSFNESQLYGMAFIARHPGFYDARPYRQPYKGKTGHNAGVMLMDLNKMRQTGWYNITLDIIGKLSGPKWAYAGDQDIFNYYNGLHPEELFEMSCAFNWRWSYCRPYKGIAQECEEAHTEGITIIHGVSGTFFKRSRFPMRLYKIFAKYDIRTSITEHLVEPIKEALKKYSDYICGKVGDVYYKQMLRYVDAQ